MTLEGNPNSLINIVNTNFMNQVDLKILDEIPQLEFLRTQGHLYLSRRGTRRAVFSKLRHILFRFDLLSLIVLLSRYHHYYSTI